MGLKDVNLIVLDVDGTMTDGGVYIDNNGIETKKFSIKDGAGIILAESVGIEFIILTGRKSYCVEQRAKELKIRNVFQGIHNKVDYLKEFLYSNSLNARNIAYIGDDLNDLPAMYICGVTACPIDAADEVKAYCDFVLPVKGGEGVVRVFVNMLLKSIGKFEEAQNKLFPITK